MEMISSTAVWPPALQQDSRVALVSPSGPVRAADDIAIAERNAREIGWIAVAAENAGKRTAYFAGSDTERAADLNTALKDESIDGVWCIRGGYGAMRLLDTVDYASFVRSPKALIGYSDITALHAAIARRCEVVSFHGPTARGKHSAFSRDSFVRAIVQQTDSCGAWPAARTVRQGMVTGRMAGGNLSLVASLIGTEYQIDMDDAIMVIEDINEAVYRVDRMMQQLLMSGSLDNCAAIAGGDFTLPPDDNDAADRSVDEVFFEVADRLGIPCISGLPFGHIEDQWTIPLGAHASLDTEKKTLNVITPNSGKS
jgi:muramoyltetrapeptide carboxypeptidase